MDNYINVGKIVNSFGIKGEVKIISDFEYQERIFKRDFPLYIGPNKIKEEIKEHRVHKNNHLVLFKNYQNINEILKYKGQNVYIKRSDLKLNSNEYLLSDLIGLNVYDNTQNIGVVIDYQNDLNNPLLLVKGVKKFYLPLNSNYLVNVDLENKKIETDKGSELII